MYGWDSADRRLRGMQMHIDKLERLVCTELKGRGSAHDFSHTKRVLSIARSIADKCGNVEIRSLSAMCLLHDVVNIEGEDEGNSKFMSTERCAKLLKDCGFDEESIRVVLDGIRTQPRVRHDRFGKELERVPQTLEEKILFDATKIDALGPIGVARWFLSISNKGWDLGLGARSYLRIINDFRANKRRLYTEFGNKLAQKRMEYSVKYMNDLLSNLEEGGMGGSIGLKKGMKNFRKNFSATHFFGDPKKAHRVRLTNMEVVMRARSDRNYDTKMKSKMKMNRSRGKKD